MTTHRLLFICLGNICRSPMAEGVFRRVAEAEGVLDRFGQAPDERAQAAAAKRGIDISGQSARQIARPDFARFDLLLAMDESNIEELERLAPKAHRAKVRRFLSWLHQCPPLSCQRKSSAAVCAPPMRVAQVYPHATYRFPVCTGTVAM